MISAKAVVPVPVSPTMMALHRMVGRGMSQAFLIFRVKRQARRVANEPIKKSQMLTNEPRRLAAMQPMTMPGIAAGVKHTRAVSASAMRNCTGP